jgi:hypothetical protein
MPKKKENISPARACGEALQIIEERIFELDPYDAGNLFSRMTYVIRNYASYKRLQIVKSQIRDWIDTEKNRRTRKTLNELYASLERNK